MRCSRAGWTVVDWLKPIVEFLEKGWRIGLATASACGGALWLHAKGVWPFDLIDRGWLAALGVVGLAGLGLAIVDLSVRAAAGLGWAGGSIKAWVKRKRREKSLDQEALENLYALEEHEFATLAALMLAGQQRFPGSIENRKYRGLYFKGILSPSYSSGCLGAGGGRSLSC